MSTLTDTPAEAPWLQLLSRWALLTAVAILALLLAFVVGLGFDQTVPQEYAELVQASRRPFAFRLAYAIDASTYVLLGGILVLFAGLFAQRTPVRAAFLATCGVGQTLSLLGAFISLRVGSDLGGRYATGSVDLQASLVQAYLVVNQIIQACFNAGSTLYAVGMLLVAWLGLSLGGVPRWLAGWFGLLGLFTLIDRAQLVVTGTPFPFFPVGLLVNVVGSMALFVAVAVVFWRGRPVGRSSGASPRLATT